MTIQEAKADKDKLEWERKEPLDGYNIHCWRLKTNPHSDVFIEVTKDGNIIREFFYPAYKQYNLQAHFEDIVAGEKQNSISGYQAASWNGISGSVFILPKEDAE